MSAKLIVLMYQVARINFCGNEIINKLPENLESMTVEDLQNWAKKEIVFFHNNNYKTLISKEDLTFVDVSIKFGNWSMTI